MIVEEERLTSLLAVVRSVAEKCPDAECMRELAPCDDSGALILGIRKYPVTLSDKDIIELQEELRKWD